LPCGPDQPSEDLRKRFDRIKHVVSDLLRQWSETIARPATLAVPERWPVLVQPTGPLKPLERVSIHEAVMATLFREFTEHRQSYRSEEETGWLILGLRDETSATVMATLPAGANRDAGEAHVQFNSEAQAVAMRLLFPRERRLKLLGVVHTHPGTLRHPSRGDFEGDRDWVTQLPGQQGIFGIGTVSPKGDEQHLAHTQQQNGLRFDWYCLKREDRRYQPRAIEVIDGPDLAEDLRPIWPILESHAAELERIARQLAKVRFNVLATPEPALGVVIGLTELKHTLQVVITQNHRQFLYEVDGELFLPNLPAEMPLEPAIYRFLQEFAIRQHQANSSD
jgi:proteasome lid subunit RPN8/RPN11